MPDRSQFWPPREVACLLKLWQTHSATQIAAKLGRTRSAICGKINRLKREGLQPAGAGGKKQYDSKPPRTPPRAMPPKIKLPPKMQPLPIEPALDMRPCLLSELTKGRCHWPLGELDANAVLFCGGRTMPNSPWCAHHFRLAVMNRKDRTR